MGAPVSIFQESPLAGEPRERLFRIHSVHRYQLYTNYHYPSTLLWQINSCKLQQQSVITHWCYFIRSWKNIGVFYAPCIFEENAFALQTGLQKFFMPVGAPVSIFQESPLAGEPCERPVGIHSVHRYQLYTKYHYPSTLLWQINSCKLQQQFVIFHWCYFICSWKNIGVFYAPCIFEENAFALQTGLQKFFMPVGSH